MAEFGVPALRQGAEGEPRQCIGPSGQTVRATVSYTAEPIRSWGGPMVYVRLVTPGVYMLVTVEYTIYVLGG